MNKARGGFTLIELMVGILMVSIAVLAIYQMFVQGSLMITEEYHRRLALEKAQAVMELASYYKTQCDSVPGSMAGTRIEQLVPPEGTDEEGIQAEYTVTVIHSTDRDPHNGLPVYSHVIVDYRWQEKASLKQQSIMLQSYF